MTIQMSTEKESKKILKQSQLDKRIWEIDAFRGLCILCVIIIHTVFDMQYFLSFDIRTPKIYDFIQTNGGVLFVILSGICVTLGSRSFRRGLIVFSCGILITLVTVLMVKLDLATSDIIINFGVLHLLGFCMMVYPLVRDLPLWALGILSVVCIAVGFYFADLRTDSHYLYMFGVIYPEYAAGDYFPIFPNLGWFLLGNILGKLIYKDKKTVFPSFPKSFFLIRFLSFCGRHSLWIYLAHQPVVYMILYLIS